MPGERPIMKDVDALERLKSSVAADAARLALFAPGAPAEALEAYRRDIGVPVPDALLALHAWRDGSRRWEGARPEAWICGRRLYSLAQSLDVKQTWDEYAARFPALSPDEQPDHAHWALWSPAWIPLMGHDSQEVALATVPCFGGPAGQIVSFDFKIGGGWKVEHASLSDWLATLAALAEASLLDAPDYDDRVRAVCAKLNPGAFNVEMVDPTRADRFDARPPAAPAPPAPGDIRVGAVVALTAGNFVGWSGTVLEVRPDGVVQIELNVFSRKVTVEARASELAAP